MRLKSEIEKELKVVESLLERERKNRSISMGSNYIAYLRGKRDTLKDLLSVESKVEAQT